LLLTSLVGAIPSAARPLDAIKSEGRLKVGMTGDYAPFSLRGSDGQVSGSVCCNFVAEEHLPEVKR
jgi:cyclohexadienyl dehydratase